MKTVRNLLALLAIGVALAACSNKQEEKEEAPPAAQPAPNDPEERFKIKIENDTFGIEYEKQKPG
jgi:hypothetical protein